jgi:hypothetical protein
VEVALLSIRMILAFPYAKSFETRVFYRHNRKRTPKPRYARSALRLVLMQQEVRSDSP